MTIKYYLTFKPRGGSMTFHLCVTCVGADISALARTNPAIQAHRKEADMPQRIKRTEEEIKAELTALEALFIKLPTARRNIAIVAAAINDRLIPDHVYDAYDTEDPEFEYAFPTAMWLVGDSDDRPSVGWE